MSAEPHANPPSATAPDAGTAGRVDAALLADLASAQTPSAAPQTQEDDYTRYELLTPVTKGGWYVPNGLMLLPPSAFFLIGIFIWILRTVKPEQVEAE